MGHGADAGAALADLLQQCSVTDGHGFDLAAHRPDGPVPDALSKSAAPALIENGVRRLSALQERLYGHATWAVLVIIQAQDAAGKDGTIKHVMSGVNPQGVTVTAFKAPGPEDLAHTFLWRAGRAVPARGMIGIFNRSYYEDVLVPRVHPTALARQHIPAGLTESPEFWKGRLDDIVGFERHLGREGTRVVKLFLNVSRDEQRRRFLARLDESDKLWKFDPHDLTERALWDDYRSAYQEAIAATATPEAPWVVIPADRKWLMRLIAMEAVITTLESLDLGEVHPDADTLARLDDARRQLEAER